MCMFKHVCFSSHIMIIILSISGFIAFPEKTKHGCLVSNIFCAASAYTYTYQDMTRRADLWPLWVGMFSFLFAPSGYSLCTSHFYYLKPDEAMISSFFLAPRKWQVSNESFACRGMGMQGVLKRNHFRLRAKGCCFGTSWCVLAGCHYQAVKSSCSSSSSPPTISPKNGGFNIVIHILLWFCWVVVSFQISRRFFMETTSRPHHVTAWMMWGDAEPCTRRWVVRVYCIYPHVL